MTEPTTDAPAEGAAKGNAASSGKSVFSEAAKIVEGATKDLAAAGIPGAKLALVTQKFTEVTAELASLVTQTTAPKLIPVVRKVSDGVVGVLEAVGGVKPSSAEAQTGAAGPASGGAARAGEEDTPAASKPAGPAAEQPAPAPAEGKDGGGQEVTA